MNIESNDLKNVKKEFKSNYRKYLENKFLFCLLHDVSKECLSDKYSSKSTLTNHLGAKIEDSFYKSILLSELNQKDADKLEKIDNFLLNEVKVEPMDKDTKRYLTNSVGIKLESYINEVNGYLKFFKDDNTASKWHLGPSDANNSLFNDNELLKSPFSKADLNASKIYEKYENLVKTIEDLETQTEKQNNEIDVKLESCFNTSIEILGLLINVLNEYKLGFYEMENRVKCEHDILDCDSLLAKIKTVANEIQRDLYTPEKLNALGIIRNHINMETSNTVKQLEQKKLNVKTFKSLGKEFDTILATYMEIKKQLERKQYTVNKLKEDDML